MLSEKPISQSRIFENQGNQIHTTQTQNTQNQQITSSNQNITKLMQFQDSFINLVHRQVYGNQNDTENNNSSDNIVKFQINHVAQHNQYFNASIKELSEQLIQNKRHYDPILREYFVKIITSNYLPLFRVNRYELTKLSLFGFDIYIDPLRAILEILNRIDHQKSMLIEQKTQTISELYRQNQSCWTALENGWKNYQIYQQFWQISFHVYLLKQYLSLAGSSLFKKDKQIIFTGCAGLFNEIVPWLCKNKLVNLLKQFASLNNILFEFHASHNYFQFYSLIPVEDQFIPVFDYTKQLYNKCKATNILTPLLFGILRNYKAFTNFINEVPNNKWTYFLSILLSGLIINFKIRVLQYSQLLELTCKTIEKLGALGKINLNIISGNISLQWKQARQFFISAFKSGYSAGQIQTWHPVQQSQIQPLIRQTLINSLFLLDEPRQIQYIKKLQKVQIISKLDQQITALTQGRQTLLTISSGLKTLQYSQKTQEALIQKTQSQLQQQCELKQNQQNQQKQKVVKEVALRDLNRLGLNLIRSVNMIEYLQNVSQQILYFVLSSLNYFHAKNQQLSSLIRQRISKLSDKINQMIMIVNRKEVSISSIKQLMIKFHLNYPPNATFPDVIPVYLHTSIPKDSLPILLQIISKMDENITQNKVRELTTAIIHRYFFIPSDSLVTVKTFQKQYQVQSDLFLLDSKINGVLISLIQMFIKKEQKVWKLSQKVIKDILRVCEWISIPILGLPVNKDDTLQSFLTWLIKNTANHQVLLIIVESAQKYLQSLEDQKVKEETASYLNQFYYNLIQDQIVRYVNSLSQIQKDEQIDRRIVDLISLQFKLYKTLGKNLIKQSQQISKQIYEGSENTQVSLWQTIIKLLIYLIQKNNESPQFVILAINVYAQVFYGVKCLNMLKWYESSLSFLILANSPQESFNILTSAPQIKTQRLNNYYYSIAEQQQQNTANKNSFNLQKIKGVVSQNIEQRVKTHQKQSLELLSTLKKCRQALNYDNICTNAQNFMPPSIQTSCLIQVMTKNVQSFHLSTQFQILKLNPKNADTILIYAIKQKNLNLLKQIGCLKILSKKTIQIIQCFQNQSQQLEGQSSQSIRDNKQQTSIKNASLFADFQKLPFQKLEEVSSSFQLSKMKFDCFLKYSEQLWFFTVCWNTNWRYFIQQMCDALKKINLPSLLLQYQQFICITNSQNNQYDSGIIKFKRLINIYEALFNKKTQYLKYLNQKDSKEDNWIRKINQISNLNVVSSRCLFQDTIKRIHDFYVLTQNKQFQVNVTLKQIFTIFKKINSEICDLVQGFIVFPTFCHSNVYTTSTVVDHKLDLGLYLQENQIQQQSEYKYYPNFNDSHLYLSELSVNQQLKNINESLFNIQEVKKTVFKKENNQKDLSDSLFEQLKSKKIILIQKSKISIQIRKQYDLKDLAKLYMLGLIADLASINLEPDMLLSQFVNRQKLSLQVMKVYNTECYHHFKLIQLVMNQQKKGQENEQQEANKKQVKKIYFTYQNEDLITNGSNVMLNKLNKSLYVNLIGNKILSKQFLFAIQMFATGCLNKKYMQTCAQND